LFESFKKTVHRFIILQVLQGGGGVIPAGAGGVLNVTVVLDDDMPDNDPSRTMP